MKRFSLLTLCLVTLASQGLASTKFHFHNAASDVSGYKLADLKQGTSLQTSVTNTTSGGTDIQVTATAGGSTVRWLTNPLSQALTISGSATCNLWGLESNGQANASFRCRYFKYTGSEGSQIWIAQAPSELTTSATNKSFSATPTSTAFAAGDRIAIYVYLENCSATSGCPTGTMGANRTVTLDYDGPTVGADGDSYLQITENEGQLNTVAAADTLGLHDAAVVQIPNVDVALADTLGVHCALCFIENWDVAAVTVGLHDAVSIQHDTNPVTPIAATATLGVHDALICCQGTPVTNPTLGLHDVLGITDFRAPAVAATLGLHPALEIPDTRPLSASATLGLHDTLAVQNARAPAVGVTFGISTTPLVTVGTSVIPITVTNSFGLHDALGMVKSKEETLADTFAASDALTISHVSPRPVTATLGLHDVLAVVDTAVANKSETLGLSLSLSVVKNGVTGRGMVIT